MIQILATNDRCAEQHGVISQLVLHSDLKVVSLALFSSCQSFDSKPFEIGPTLLPVIRDPGKVPPARTALSSRISERERATNESNVRTSVAIGGNVGVGDRQIGNGTYGSADAGKACEDHVKREV